MAGKGPPPKDPEKRARRNAEPVPTRRLKFVKAKQPPLPARMPDGHAWPARTRGWWKHWGADGRTERFSALEWDYLLDTAVLHGRLWRGETAVAAELRLRMAKFGTTTDDMQRLRLRYDTGLEGDDDAGADDVKTNLPKGATARERYGDLRVVRGGRK